MPPKRRARDDIDSRPESQALLAAFKRHRKKLLELQARCDDHWTAEDRIYRYYHGSFKVYALQETTMEIVDALRELAGRPMNDLFFEIIKAGTGKTWKQEHNSQWSQETRPILEAYFHARHMLDMAIKYSAELKRAPCLLPSGWATLLYLFGLR